MRHGRLTSAAVAALALTTGAAGLHHIRSDASPAPSRPPIEVVRRPTAGAAAAAPVPVPVAAPPPLDVPIAPPPETFTGEVAPAAPVPAPFTGASGGLPGETFALVVGIDDYPGDQADLDYATADASAVDAALGGFGVPAANRVVLLDGQARRGTMAAAVSSLVQRAGPGTTVVFAFAGHVRKLDRDTEAIVAADGGLISDAELAALLAPAQAERMWLLMATCYGGGFVEALAPGRVLTAAAGADQLAYESPAVGGSYLVHYMVREGWLKHQAGSSVQEAFAFADGRIAASRPDRRPVQYEVSGGALRFGPGSPAPSNPPASGPSAPPPPPPTTAPPEPERQCTLVVLCRSS